MGTQATTDGLVVFAGALDEEAVVRRVLNDTMPQQHIFCLTNADEVTTFRRKQGSHISLLYLQDEVPDLLDRLAHRLVCGTTVIVVDSLLVDFYTWADDNNREMHVLSRAGDSAFAVMLAN